MSDEYGTDGSGFRGSLVNDSQQVQGLPKEAQDAATGNYPPANDSTASGGYGSSINPYSDAAQRGQPTSSSFQSSEEGQPQSFDSKSLVSQSLSGGDLSGELQDAKQGVDEGTRREVGPDGGPKGYNESWESREEADGRLGAPTRYTR